MASSRKSPGVDRAGRLEAQVALQMSALVTPGATVTAALSGGIDSIVLLELLRKAAPQSNFRLRALHVNHGLSRHAPAWEAFCRAHCSRRRIAFEAVRVSVQGQGANVEAQARVARYRAFAQSGSQFVALAHHRDDQAETLLLNLLRGSGVQGLAAMPASRALAMPASGEAKAPVRLIRPLLAIGRSDIEHYARLRRLRWVDDESNRDLRFARNFVRGRVLPLLEQRFPGAADTLARSAGHLGEAATLLEELGAADCVRASRREGLDVQRLCSLGGGRAANALRHFLARHGERPPSLARTREILRQLVDAKHDAQIAIDLQQAVVRRFRGCIELVPHSPVDTQGAAVRWSGERRVRLADGSELSASATRGVGVSAARLDSAAVLVRARSGGERIRLTHTGRTRTLKNLLQEAGVAPWLRTRLPLLYCGEALVWVPFVGVAADFQAAPGERAWQFSWQVPSKHSRL
jgi:tRNA(Ile)-lysidine synthase